MTANTHVTRTADGDLALGIIDVDGERWDLVIDASAARTLAADLDDLAD